MNGTTESHLVRPINAPCHPLLRYLHKLSGVHYSAIYESPYGYELNPLHGRSRHATVEELANAEVWQLLP